MGLKSSRWPWTSLPETLFVPERLMDNVEELWNRMFDDPQHNEQGACIVFDAECILKLDDHVIGESSHAVKPTCLVGERPDHLGFFHTHWLLDGDAQVGFSHLDFAGVLEDGESLSLVCSANQIFALMRTAKSPEPAPVSKAREREFLEVFIHYIRKGLRSNDAARMANHDLCRRLGLAFYAGRLRQPLNLAVAP